MESTSESLKKIRGVFFGARERASERERNEVPMGGVLRGSERDMCARVTQPRDLPAITGEVHTCTSLVQTIGVGVYVCARLRAARRV